MDYISKETVLIIISNRIKKIMNESNNIKFNDPKKKQLHAVWIELSKLKGEIERYGFDVSLGQIKEERGLRRKLNLYEDCGGLPPEVIEKLVTEYKEGEKKNE